MGYQINQNDINKLVFDGEHVHYSIPIPPVPRACPTGVLIRHIWKTIEFVNFVTRVLPDHVNRSLDITVIPEKFDPNEIIEGKFLGIITKYRPKNFLTDLEVQYAKRDSIFGVRADRVFIDEFIEAIKNEEN